MVKDIDYLNNTSEVGSRILTKGGWWCRMAVALCLSTIIFVSKSKAYIPPSQFIVDKIAETKKSYQEIYIQSRIIAYKKGNPTPTHLQETLWVDVLRGRIHSKVTLPGGKEVFSVVRKLQNGEIERTGTVGLNASPLDYLLFSSRRQDVTVALVRSNIPIKVEAELLMLENEKERRDAEVLTLRRHLGKKNWVLGRPGVSVAHLWVEKDAFLPSKYSQQTTMADPNDDSQMKPVAVEVLLDQYRFKQGFPYPNEIVLKFGEEIVLISKVESMAVIDRSSDKSKASEKSYRFSVKQNGYVDQGQAIEIEYYSLISNFYRWVR